MGSGDMADTIQSVMAGIADGIRSKTGSTDKLKATEMASAIEAIESGGGEDHTVEDDLITRSISGEYTNSRVTAVGKSAFQYCSGLVSVSFPNATNVGITAFNFCDNLASVNIPNVTIIERSAFESCSSLRSVGSLDKVVALQSGVFSQCHNLVSLSLPLVTSIGPWVFNNNSRLTSLTIGTNDSTIVCTLNNTNAINGSAIAKGTGYIYVADSLVDQYKAATNWSVYADQIKGISEKSTS